MKFTIGFILFVVCVFKTTNSFTQIDQAYQLYRADGKKITSKKVIQELHKNEFVFFGEYHDNPISHWLQFEMLTILHDKNQKELQVGFEMFERDQQDLMNQYLEGGIDEKRFKDSCRLWPNYKTDYAPIVNFAKEHQLKVIATNIPRKFASQLFKQGRSSLISLPESEKSLMAPLDFNVDTTLSQYAALKEMEQHMGGKHMLEAQAIKDATMAESILKYWMPGKVFFHLNGAYHSDFHQGIVWYLKQSKPEAKVLTISTVSQKQINQLESEHFGRADIIICVNENMTKTH